MEGLLLLLVIHHILNVCRTLLKELSLFIAVQKALLPAALCAVQNASI